MPPYLSYPATWVGIRAFTGRWREIPPLLAVLSAALVVFLAVR